MKPVSKGKGKLNKREGALITAVVIVAAALLVWQTAGRTLHEEITGLVDRSNTLSTEIADLEEIMNRKESIENEWLQLQEEEARLNILLPEIWELPSVLGELELVVEYFDNQISSFQAREVISKDGYTELPFMLSAIGSPSSILAIIKALEAFPHLLVIEYLRWSSADLTNVVLEIHFRVHFYSCLEGGINNAASIPLQGS